MNSECKYFLYYAKSDLTKEPIDKVSSCDYDEALCFFLKRKNMKKDTFLEIYEIVENEFK